MADRTTYRVIVIGAGPGGYAAAFLAADLGLDTCLIDPRVNPGGVCLYEGCIPSKALLQCSELILESKSAASRGIHLGDPRIDRSKVRAWKNGVVEKLTEGLAFLCKKRGIDYIRNRARFLDAHTIAVGDDAGAPARILSFDYAVLATGSVPVRLRGLPAGSPRVLDSTAALELDESPSSLLVVGGGYIGFEIGTIYAAFGARVSIVEMMPRVLSGVDDDLLSVFMRSTARLFESVRTSTTVSIESKKNGVHAKFTGNNAAMEERTYDAVLVAVGRKPMLEGLGLENTGVEIDSKGFVKINERRQTTEASIYAVGDITGPPLLAHKAMHEGRIAAEAIAGRHAAFEPNAIPAVIYTDPAIAWCGLTETQARAENRDIEIARFPWSASGRAAGMGKSNGLTKLIVDPKSERILGAGIVGTDAGELISEATLAIEMGATVSDLALTIHPHPTLSETIMEAAESFYGQSTNLLSPKMKRERRR